MLFMFVMNSKAELRLEYRKRIYREINVSTAEQRYLSSYSIIEELDRFVIMSLFGGVIHTTSKIIQHFQINTHML